MWSAFCYFFLKKTLNVFPPSPPKKTKCDDTGYNFNNNNKTQIEDVFHLFCFTPRKNSGWLQLIPLPLQSCSYKNNITMRNKIDYFLFLTGFLVVYKTQISVGAVFLCRGGVLRVCFCNMDVHWRTLFLAGEGGTSQCDGQDPCPLTL